VPFQSSVAVFAVCAFCRSMVVRTDEAIQRLGEMAQLPPDLTPLRIGTRGEWQRRPFQIAGRVRVEYEGGSWTEWFAVFSDGGTGWLAEAQGFFMLTTLHEPEEKLPASAERLKPGAPLPFDGHTYLVVDIKTVHVIAAEGELPDVSPPGSERTNSDLAGKEGRCGTLEFHADGTELYLGHYATFEALQLQDLRPVPGWSAEVPIAPRGANSLSCPECGAPVELRATGQTQAAVCGSCNTLIDTANPVWRILQKGQEGVKKAKPLIPIGTRGELLGTEWEVIGFQQRGNKDTSWTEYLLFNPWRGFRFLTTWGGHWNFVDRVLDLPEPARGGLRLRNRLYRTFARGEVKVQSVLGEFYWKVKRGEHADFADYIDPPELLSSELYPKLQEQTYSLGSYVEPDLIKQAFKLKDLPRRDGTFANQPNPWERRWRGLWPWWLLAIIVACCIQIGPSSVERRVPWSGAFTYQRPVPKVAFMPTASQPMPSSIEQYFRDGPGLEGANTVTTPRFNVVGPGTQPVEVEISAPVMNSWIGFDIDLVNTASGAVYRTGLEVSYYYGADSDGSWTEGSQKASGHLSEVPAGEYYLQLDPDADPALPGVDYTVRVETGGTFVSNFLLSLLAVSLYPVFVWLRRRAWESARWAESDLS
jgi:hypothetical protein